MCCWRQDRTKVPAIVIAKGFRGCSLQGRERDAAWPNSRVCSFKDPHLSCIVLMCSITELPLLYHAWLSYRNYFQHLSQKLHLSWLLSWNECVLAISLENLFLSLILKLHLCYRNNCTQWHSVPSLQQHGEWFAVLGNWSQHKPTGFCNLSVWCLWFKCWTHCISTSGQPELGTLL